MGQCLAIVNCKNNCYGSTSTESSLRKVLLPDFGHDVNSQQV